MATRTSSDENWALARSIQITASGEGLRRGCHGVLAAAPHATGWFIFARVDPNLAAADVDDFVEFVTVRSYLLLEQGPDSDLWERGIDGVWRTYCVAAEFDVARERISA